MMWAALLSSPLARKFGIYALVALLLVGAVLTWKVQVTTLRAQRDTAQTEAAQLRTTLATLQAQQAAANAAQAARAIEQTKIEVKRDDRAKRNTFLLGKPQTKPWGDTVVPDNLIDGMLDDSASGDGVPSVATANGPDTRTEETAEGFDQ